MSVKIKGLSKLKNDLRNTLNKVSEIAGDEALSMIKDNLKPHNDTGALSKSFKVRVSVYKAIIESDLEYANIQDKGGKIKITESMRGKMWALYKSTGNEMYKRIAITKKSFITINPIHYSKINEVVLSRRIDRELNKLTKRI
jgi:phage gpG-like protein